MAFEVFEEMLDFEDELQIASSKLENGTIVVDAGVKVQGGLGAGVYLSRLCMSDLANIQLTPCDVLGAPVPGIQVATDHPAISCMASQCAMWQIKGEKYFAMGSGPARVLARKTKDLYEKMGFEQYSDVGILVLESNKLPDANDDTDAYYTRWIILNFPYEFVRGEITSSIERPAIDKNRLKAELVAEMSGILNWALVGLKRLQENGHFTNELSSNRMREIYVKLSNSLKAFVIEQCDVTNEPKDFMSKDDFYRAYACYCQDKKLLPFTKEKVGRELPRCNPGQIAQGRDTIGKERIFTWRGIRLKTADEFPPGDDSRLDDFESQPRPTGPAHSGKSGRPDAGISIIDLRWLWHPFKPSPNR